MLNFNRSKQTAEEMERVHNDLEEMRRKQSEQQARKIPDFNNLITELLSFESCMNSPIDGSPIGVIRTEDVINTIAEFQNINLDKTDFSHFKK